MKYLKIFENGDFIDYLNKDKNKLYDLDIDRLTVYVVNIEDDMQERLGINCMYTSYSNGTVVISFELSSNYDFETVRKIKKYFLDNIPHVITVDFDTDGFTVRLTRLFGLGALVINEY